MRTARLDTSRSELRRRENGVVRNEGALAPGWLRHLVRAPAAVAGEGVARDPALGAAHDLKAGAGVVGEGVADHVVAHALRLLVSPRRMPAPACRVETLYRKVVWS